MYKIDSVDIKLLELLQINSNRGIKEMAMDVGLTVTPVHERIKRLEKLGYIKKYGIEINKEMVGLGLIVFCQVSLQTHSKNLIERFESSVNLMVEVIEAYHISGEFDYLLKVVCHDNKKYHDFLVHKLSKLEMVAKVQSNFIMFETKEHRFYSIPNS